MLTYFTALMAEKTHWSEDSIIRMPFFKILSYLHVFNIRAGFATDWAQLDAPTLENARTNFNNLFD